MNKYDQRITLEFEDNFVIVGGMRIYAGSAVKNLKAIAPIISFPSVEKAGQFVGEQINPVPNYMELIAKYTLNEMYSLIQVYQAISLLSRETMDTNISAILMIHKLGYMQGMKHMRMLKALNSYRLKNKPKIKPNKQMRNEIRELYRPLYKPTIRPIKK